MPALIVVIILIIFIGACVNNCIDDRAGTRKREHEERQRQELIDKNSALTRHNADLEFQNSELRRKNPELERENATLERENTTLRIEIKNSEEKNVGLREVIRQIEGDGGGE